MAIEIVDFPIKNGGSFHSYVSLPEGNWSFVHMFPLYLPNESYMNPPGHTWGVFSVIFGEPSMSRIRWAVS